MASAPIVVDEAEGDNMNDAQLINEEYKIWKKNTPFLYDTVVTHALTWPSLTCQWFPDQTSPEGADYTVNRMLLGTHTSGKGTDQLMIAEVMLPKIATETAGKDLTELYDEEKQELGSYTVAKPRIKVVHTINHEGEINRARYMPQNTDLLATKAINGDVNIFDRTKHPSKAPPGRECRPDIVLKGLKSEGYGLSWSPVNKGHIVSAGEDDYVCHWDVTQYSKTSTSLNPLRKYHGHTGQINDVDWHHTHDYMFASVGDDCLLNIWDTRNEGPKPANQEKAHKQEINAVSFAPYSEHLIATGSADSTVALWDIRKLSLKLHSFESHVGPVTQVAWSPHLPTYFASASEDRRIHVWNLDLIGAEQTPDDAEDGPPELMFVHGGHTSKPSDLSWSPIAKWHLASTAEDNVLQVWEPSRHLRADGGYVDEVDLE